MIFKKNDPLEKTVKETVDFLTTEQTESYGRFIGEPDELLLARYFHLDEADKEFIGKSRG